MLILCTLDPPVRIENYPEGCLVVLTDAQGQLFLQFPLERSWQRANCEARPCDVELAERVGCLRFDGQISGLESASGKHIVLELGACPIFAVVEEKLPSETDEAPSHEYIADGFSRFRRVQPDAPGLNLLQESALFLPCGALICTPVVALEDLLAGSREGLQQ